MEEQNVIQIKPYKMWKPTNKPDIEIYQHVKSKELSTICRVQEHRLIDITQDLVWCYPTFIRNPILHIITKPNKNNVIPFKKLDTK